MTATTTERNTKKLGTSSEPEVLSLPVAAATKILKGTIVCDNGSGYATPGATATTLIAVGVADKTVDNTSGSAGDLSVPVRRGCFRFENSSAGDAIAIAQRFDVCWVVDNQTVAKTNGTSTRSRAGIIIDVDSFGVWVLIGASVILDYSALETIVAAHTASLQSTDNLIPLSLNDFREVDANGDVGAIAANGGILASDTTPILRGDATNQSQEIYWAAGDVDPIACQIALPDNLDDTADVVLECVVSSGTTDDADLAIETTWDAGTQVADAVVDTASATPHVSSATIDAADVPSSPDRMTLIITPPTHATDAIILHGIRVKYTGKYLT